MTDEEKLAKLVELAARTGKLHVAWDMLEAIDRLSKAGDVRVKALVGIKLYPSKLLEPGTVLAIEDSPFSSYVGFQPVGEFSRDPAQAP